MKVGKKSGLAMVLAMAIFGTIGIFRRLVPLPSSFISLERGVVGTVILLLFAIATKQPLRRETIKVNLFKLAFSGALIGLNWIFLFEAYNYTTVATATICYYMAPVFVMIVTPFVFKEKLTVKRVCIVFIALVGMFLVSGAGPLENEEAASDPIGIILGLAAAVLYAIVVIINKMIKDINPYEKTVTQLASAAIVLLPYVLITNDFSEFSFTPVIIIALIVMGVVHTGLAYTLYFGSMDGMNPISVAIYSYIDPVVAIILSALILKEPMTLWQLIGAVLILGSTFAGDVSKKEED